VLTSTIRNSLEARLGESANRAVLLSGIVSKVGGIEKHETAYPQGAVPSFETLLNAWFSILDV
jgi:hypothetical protein